MWPVSGFWCTMAENRRNHTGCAFLGCQIFLRGYHIVAYMYINCILWQIFFLVVDCCIIYMKESWGGGRTGEVWLGCWMLLSRTSVLCRWKFWQHVYGFLGVKWKKLVQRRQKMLRMKWTFVAINVYAFPRLTSVFIGLTSAWAEAVVIPKLMHWYGCRTIVYALHMIIRNIQYINIRSALVNMHNVYGQPCFLYIAGAEMDGFSWLG